MTRLFHDDDDTDKFLRAELRALAIKCGIVADQPALDELYSEIRKLSSENHKLRSLKDQMYRNLVAVLLTNGGSIEIPPDFDIVPVLEGYTIRYERTGHGGLFVKMTAIPREENKDA